MPLLAQPIPPAAVADKELGWIKVYEFKPTSEPLKVDVRVYSAAQRNIAALLEPENRGIALLYVAAKQANSILRALASARFEFVARDDLARDERSDELANALFGQLAEGELRCRVDETS